MSNYSLNQKQTAAILDAIAIIKLQPVKDSASLEDGPIAGKIPVVTATLKSVLEEIEALLITSTSEKAERYLEKVSQTLSLIGLTQEEELLLHLRTKVTASNDELKDKYKEVDIDLKLIEGIKQPVLEALIDAGFSSGLQVLRHDTREVSFLTKIQPSNVVILQNNIKMFLDKSIKK